MRTPILALSCFLYLPKAISLTSDYENDRVATKTRPAAPFPYYCILPVSTYNRICASKRRLTEGFRRPTQPGNLGWDMCISNIAPPFSSLPLQNLPATVDDDANDNCNQTAKSDRLVSWPDVIGLNSITPCLPEANLDPQREVRIVFVRRQSADTGPTINPVLQKSIFGRKSLNPILLHFNAYMRKYGQL